MYKLNKTLPLRRQPNILYAKLGVSPDASAEAIRSAYRVLEGVYCPDGAYSDDVMQHAFLEISNAAGIPCNPRTRWLYDCGYIDERGRPTRAGSERASRLRRLRISGALISFAVLFIIAFWVTNPNGAHTGIQASPSQASPSEGRVTQNRDQAFQKVVSPAMEKTIVFADQSPLAAAATAATETMLEEYPLPSIAPSFANQEVDARSVEASAGMQPIAKPSSAEANPHDYLPPETIFNPKHNFFAGGPKEKKQSSALISPKNNPFRRQKLSGRKQTPERQQTDTFFPPIAGSRSTDIWMVPRAGAQTEDRLPASAAVRTAQCLACITNDRANCSKTCP
ncbi:MAG: DnaJ domain-containing protein [Rhodomicrobium sp.]